MTAVRIVTEPLGGSPLSRAMQAGDVPAAWSIPRPSSADGWQARMQERMRDAPWGQRLSDLSPALNATGAAAERLDRLRRDGGVVVTTGQQPGLFGGPIYTWSKAMSTIAFADSLEQRTGIPTVPLFWAATDDADFVEASRAVVARPGGVDVLRATDEPPAGTPMALAPLGDLTDAMRRLSAAAGSAADPRPLTLATEAYGAPECTAGDAYVQLLRGVLAPLGMPVLDASHPAVREAAQPTLVSAARRSSAIESALKARAREIAARGYAPQVSEVDGLSLVFVRRGTAKRRLSVAEAEEIIDGWLTPNVLLRPIVEHAILPTVAYVAGPGELAYFAQVSAVADALARARPLAVPRWSATLIEPHVQQLLDRFGVDVHDLSHPHALEGQVARQALDESTRTTLARLRAVITALPADLAGQTESLGLARVVDGASHALLHRLERLERRLVAAVKRRESALLRDVATLRAALYPLDVRQERMLNPLPIFARHGLALLDEMRLAASTHVDRMVGAAAASPAAGRMS